MKNHPFLKQPLSIEDFADDITDFLVVRAYIKIVIDRLDFWHKNRAINTFKSTLKQTMNHMTGIEHLIDFYFKNTLEGDKGVQEFNQTVDDMYHVVFDYFTKDYDMIKTQILEKLIKDGTE